jgi:hypothetical protein
MHDMMRLKELNNLIWKDENEKNDKLILNYEHDDCEQSLELVCLYHEHDGLHDEYWLHLWLQWRFEINIMRI